ncbi:DExH-box splicing factor binding site-domain-containing protein [Clohesyomyces aquaticus]|uniref:Pre-mRNA-splicing factor n=1 Tax=Clohesyomyces aquaticus TaxID=1231657 RepID=A0A1Y1ZGN5_9PLEO|nr:DExH-box splicing factor binding site-domain-containing protein [Clohesyomyces aquaticus]
MSAPKMGGFKLSLGSKPVKSNALKTASTTLTKRPRAVLDEEEPEDNSTGPVEISGFDAAAGGALDVRGAKKEEEVRIINPLANRNWRAEAKRKREAKEGRRDDNVERFVESKIAYGLTVVKKDKGETETVDAELEVKEEMVAETEAEPDNLTEEERLDRDAMDALLNGKNPEERTIIAAPTEEQAFEKDFQTAPDAPSLDAYLATPIDGFGAAILRGFGWKDGEQLGPNRKPASTKPMEIKRRAALLGVGAKPEAAAGIELGSWGQGKAIKGKRAVDQSYNPVALRNKNTGEILTEEELKTKLEQQKLVVEDEEREPGKRSRKRKSEERDDDGEEEEYRRERERRKRKEREREKDRDRDRDRGRDRRDKEKEKDWYRDSDRERDRRDKDRPRDSDRERTKERDRYRDSDRERGSDRDREKDRYRDSERRRRDRSRDNERDRDSDDTRKRKRREYDYEDEERASSSRRKREG